MTDRHTHRTTFSYSHNTQNPALTDNSHINSFQKQTQPHPEISYGETDNPYNKQTLSFGIKEKTAVAKGMQQGRLAGMWSDNLSNI